jgi:hypothetical protein
MKLSEKLIIGAVAGIILLIGKCQPKESTEQVQRLIETIQEKGKTTCTGKLEGKPVAITLATNGNGINATQIFRQFTVITTIQPATDSVGFTKFTEVKENRRTDEQAVNSLMTMGDSLSLPEVTKEQLEAVRKKVDFMTLAETVGLYNNVCGYGHTRH